MKLPRAIDLVHPCALTDVKPVSKGPDMFTKALSYQFGVFFSEMRDLPPTLNVAVPNAFQTVASPKYLLRGLKEPALENGFVAFGPGPMMPTQNLVWTAGAGVWRIVISKLRMDIYFDAQMLRDVREMESAAPSLSEIVDYISPKIVQFMKSTGLHTSRLALIVAGQTQDDATAGFSSEVLARKFLPASNREGVGEELIDGVVRLNMGAIWSLGEHFSGVKMNRIETVSANWVLTDDGPQTSLSWQADVNISPLTSPLDLKGSDGSIAEFFKQACSWIEARRQTMEDEYGTTSTQ